MRRRRSEREGGGIKKRSRRKEGDLGREERGKGRLLFTAVRKACHNGIAGFLLKVGQYELDLWKKLSTKPSMAHPRLRDALPL